MKTNRIHILNVPFDAVTYAQALQAVQGFVSRGQKVYLTTPNPEMLVEANRNQPFLEVLRGSALALPDGIGILWAATYLNQSASRWNAIRWFHWLWSLVRLAFQPSHYSKVLPQRVTGIDLMQKIVEYSEKTGWKIFLLGAGDGVAQIAAENLQHCYPKATIVDTYAGSPSMDEAEAITERINQAAPDLLFVAYGSPAQEFWIARHLHRLQTVRVAMGVGGAFDFIAGKVRRAPVFMRRLGLEWLWRLLREPRRFRRIWRATVTFSRLVMRKKFA